MRLVILAIIFYIVYKIIKAFAFISVKARQQSYAPKQPQNVPREKSITAIDKKDIVEAEFVEINNTKE